MTNESTQVAAVENVGSKPILLLPARNDELKPGHEADLDQGPRCRPRRSFSGIFHHDTWLSEPWGLGTARYLRESAKGSANDSRLYRETPPHQRIIVKIGGDQSVSVQKVLNGDIPLPVDDAWNLAPSGHLVPRKKSRRALSFYILEYYILMLFGFKVLVHRSNIMYYYVSFSDLDGLSFSNGFCDRVTVQHFLLQSIIQ
jgi:hypothetical protein